MAAASSAPWPAALPGASLLSGYGGLPAFARPVEEDEGMLYVACEIGGITLEMMIDTGAQTSVISAPLMQQLRLTGHLDSSQQGIATGVGQARILGKLRGVPVKMGHVEFKLDFSVIEMNENLFMLGLDQMRKCKCIVDLENRNLVFGGTGGIEVPFLRDPPKRTMRLSNAGCPTM